MDADLNHRRVDGFPSPSGGPQNRSPQATLDAFWKQLLSARPGAVEASLPERLHDYILPLSTFVTPFDPRDEVYRNRPDGGGCPEPGSYEAAAEACRMDVARTVRECRRVNDKFTDMDFDIGSDLAGGHRGIYLFGLQDTEPLYTIKEHTPQQWLDLIEKVQNSGLIRWNKPPGSVHRVPWIFRKVQLGKDDRFAEPTGTGSSLQNSRQKEARTGELGHDGEVRQFATFLASAFTNTDVTQGRIGDCWWLSGVAAVCSKPELLERICVARNVECGVYGFVFYRDGEWVHTLVDDQLYISEKDWDDVKPGYHDPSGKQKTKYRRCRQSGSEALYFGKCADDSQFWLPLLEKAYAKLHGDYEAIHGGWAGEAMEDLTGGNSVCIDTSSVCDKEALWQQLSLPHSDYLFAANSLRPTSEPARLGTVRQTTGLAPSHTYTILATTEERNEDGHGTTRLVKLRNPWGARDARAQGTWDGAWSDGSKEWTAYWINKLGRTFGDDASGVSNRWVSVRVPWIDAYLKTTFTFTLTQPRSVVLALSQLDARYYQGLEGRYRFGLDFLVRNVDQGANVYVVRANGSGKASGYRSVSVEINDLPAGTYEVFPKVTAYGLGIDNHYISTEEAIRIYDYAQQKAENYGDHVRAADAFATFEAVQQQAAGHNRQHGAIAPGGRQAMMPVVQQPGPASAESEEGEDEDEEELMPRRDGRQPPIQRFPDPPNPQLEPKGNTMAPPLQIGAKRYDAWCTIGLRVHCQEKVEVAIGKFGDEPRVRQHSRRPRHERQDLLSIQEAVAQGSRSALADPELIRTPQQRIGTPEDAHEHNDEYEGNQQTNAATSKQQETLDRQPHAVTQGTGDDRPPLRKKKSMRNICMSCDLGAESSKGARQRTEEEYEKRHRCGRALDKFDWDSREIVCPGVQAGSDGNADLDLKA
ncbi:hypothetical protein LTR85_011195 [Meristemomyces frigidus]|nr:hypothetical protein LTR85_011195 [Meristemomyces frigidus]